MTRKPSRDAKSSPTFLTRREPYYIGTLVICSICRTVVFGEELRTVFLAHLYDQDMLVSAGTPVFTGLYSEPAGRGSNDTEEAGFRLVLPFALRPEFCDQDGARMSDGRLLATGSFSQLFQLGWFYPFGGGQRSQMPDGEAIRPVD